MSIQEIKWNIFLKNSVNAKKKEGKKQMKSTNQPNNNKKIPDGLNGEQIAICYT